MLHVGISLVSCNVLPHNQRGVDAGGGQKVQQSASGVSRYRYGVLRNERASSLATEFLGILCPLLIPFLYFINNDQRHSTDARFQPYCRLR